MLPTIITTDTELKELTTYGLTKPVAALDTEFLWEKTYYPKLGIIQIGFNREECFIVDVLSIENISLLAPLLSSEKVVKIFHNAKLDLILIKEATNCIPQNIFDTQTAAGFIGHLSTISLCNLVESLLQIHLDKTETRTNWLKRPLSEKQLDYALDDVRYLPEVHDIICTQSKDKGVITWLNSEMALFDDPSFYDETSSYERYKKLKGVSSLSRIELAVLKELTHWRELQAQEEDIPRQHVLSDKALVKLAKEYYNTPDKIKPDEDLYRSRLKKYGLQIKNNITKATSLPQNQYPVRIKKSPYNKRVIKKVTSVIEIIKKECEQLAIDTQLTATQSEIKSFVKSVLYATKNTSILAHGWRKEFIGQKICSFLKKK